MSIQVQIGLNRYKYVQIGPNESNWVQMGPNRYKQVQKRQRKSTKIKIKTNQAIGRYWKKQVQMGSNGSIGVQNYHELNRMAFKPRSPGSCFHYHRLSELFQKYCVLCLAYTSVSDAGALLDPHLGGKMVRDASGEIVSLIF